MLQVRSGKQYPPLYSQVPQLVTRNQRCKTCKHKCVSGNNLSSCRYVGPTPTTQFQTNLISLALLSWPAAMPASQWVTGSPSVVSASAGASKTQRSAGRRRVGGASESVTLDVVVAWFVQFFYSCWKDQRLMYYFSLKWKPTFTSEVQEQTAPLLGWLKARFYGVGQSVSKYYE